MSYKKLIKRLTDAATNTEDPNRLLLTEAADALNHYREELASQRMNNEKRNRLLDTLNIFWCDGGIIDYKG